MHKLTDISYSHGHTTHRLLDVYLPDAGRSNGACMLLIHGGGFREGDRQRWATVSERLAGEGYACIVPTYRMLPDFMYPAWLEDARLAMQYAIQHSDMYAFSPDRIVTMGSSAGAYLALMLAVLRDGDDLGRTDELRITAPLPAAVIAYCPGVGMSPDLIPGPDHAKPALVAESQVITHIRGGEPPMLFVHGTADEAVPFSSSEKTVQAINQRGGRATLAPLPDVKHGFGYGVRTPAQLAALEIVRGFLKESLPA